MNTQYTSGPWETGQASWNEEGDVRYTLHGIKEARVADCRLIQSAPDLLEALIELDQAAEQSGLYADFGGTFEVVKAAIAKALGKGE